MKSDGNVKFIILIVVLCLALGGFAGWYFTRNFSKTNETSTNVETKSDNNVQKIDVEKVGKELYDMIQVEDCGKLFYAKNKYTSSMMDENTKETIAMELVAKEKKTIISGNNYELSSNGDYVCNTEPCAKTTVKESDFDAMYYKIFGSHNYSKTKFYNDINIQYCSFKDGNVECYTVLGGDVCGIKNYTQYDHSEENNGQIIVYSKFLSYDDFAKLSKDTEGTQKVDYDNYLDTNNNLSDEQVIKHYENKTGLYKSTFVKNSDDGYYWESTEFVS